ncbi:type II toxin-antitoxin system ParD family antitoxin [Methylobacterium sp. Leaf456]|uniref:type II toxin-antitoxin system ParD family antitoxin n=1 Tax=Methylobacterium sp. Leaf456 TaxID=1736382 RepID=UPI0009E67DB4|nr:type II toxin-antitoxin system ParD family antitoxin [Methylobacterium sp. Leaf456]
MPRRVATNVSLTPELAAFIAEQVASGRFGSASEVVRAALRGLEREEARQHKRRAKSYDAPSLSDG